jgi:hypothetical protein
MSIYTSIVTSARNATGSWEVIEREAGTVEDFDIAEVSARDIGGEPGQELLLRLMDDGGTELARREIATR